MLHKLTADKNYEKVKRVTFESIHWKEKDLEKLLSKNIDDLIYSNDLMVIFNERQRQEEPDILALDKNGDLYIFELKRWISNKENLLQVLRYGQLFGSSDYYELNELYQKYSKYTTTLSKVHQEYFQLSDDSALREEDFNCKQHFLIVTNGLDQKTVEAISYWKKNSLNIDAIVYWIFEIKGEYFLEFTMYSPIEGLLEYDSSAYILNTNSSNDISSTEKMLTDKKASAYHPGWREKILRLQKDDTVFLYKTGDGIIAYGVVADGKLQKEDYDGFKDYEYFMKLKDFKKLSHPLSPSKMKEVTNQGFSFRGTMYSISSDCKELLINEIKKNFL